MKQNFKQAEKSRHFSGQRVQCVSGTNLAGSGCHSPSSMVSPQFHRICIFKSNLNLESLKNFIFPRGRHYLSHLHSYQHNGAVPSMLYLTSFATIFFTCQYIQSDECWGKLEGRLDSVQDYSKISLPERNIQFFC